MTNYRRYYLKGGRYFFTVVLANRHLSLLTEHITELRGAFREVMIRHPFNIDAMVVLPNHLHCIWTLPSGEDNFSMRWRQIKTVFSKSLPPCFRQPD
ncbi:MAG: transposase [Thioploca sp.]|nr:transposase [Thioploca sp.]